MSTVVGVLAPLFAPAKNGGGPIRTLRALVSDAPADFSVYVLTGDRDLGATARLPVEFDSWKSWENASVYYASARSPRALLKGFRALRAMDPEVIYLNGYFDPRFSILPQLLWRFGFWGRAVRLLAPRGEFGEGALKRRAFKKRAFIAMYRALRLHKALYWHASTEIEAQAIRDLWGNDAAILVRENDTLLPESAVEPLADVDPGDARPLRAVFLGRLVEHKGLHIALDALTNAGSPIEFDIYGPTEDPAYLDRCRALAAATPAEVTVRFLGPVEPDRTRHTLSGYDVLLMPTAGENFGHVIAESLSVACPVICSEHTPWSGTLENGGGSVVSLTTEAWALAIEQRATSSAAQRLVARRAAGRAYNRWRSRPTAPHVFELLEQYQAPGRSA